MISADTSVVVRYLVGSPSAQAKRAAALIEAEREIGLAPVVILETAHVLRTQYGVDRADVLETLIELLTRENIAILGMPEIDVLDALVRARSLPGSPLPDALVAATSRWSGAVPLYTFDQDLHLHGVPVATP